jgi:hypothetical protein
VTVNATQSGSSTAVFTYSYVGPNGQRASPCPDSPGTQCTFQPLQAGTYQLRIEVRDPLSPRSFDDVRQLSIEVQP